MERFKGNRKVAILITLVVLLGFAATGYVFRSRAQSHEIIILSPDRATDLADYNNADRELYTAQINVQLCQQEKARIRKRLGVPENWIEKKTGQTIIGFMEPPAAPVKKE